MGKEKFQRRGMTLIEVLVGITLVLIVFLGIFTAYELGLQVVGLSERKITATQIAQGEIEKIRNLPYLDVGLIDAQGDEAKGILERTSRIILNEIEYKIERKVIKISDEADGLNEDCPVDYKKAEIKVSFSGKLKGEVILSTNVMPKDIIEEARFCQENPTGILTVQVFNARGEIIPSPLIEIFDPQTNQLLSTKIPAEGKYNFPLSPNSYKVKVSKEGYSSEKTYNTEEIAMPEKPDPIILEGQITPLSFSIDKVSSMHIKTLSTFSQQFFSDTFLDESKISEKENVLVSTGQVTLATSSEGYLSSGYLISIEISPSNLLKWENLSFTDEEPEGTDLKYQIYYASGTEWILVPNDDLPGNSIGFDLSPVDLSHLPIATYSRLKLKANLSTQSPPSTPVLKDWQISWKTSLPTPIPNVSFSLRGEKLIGKDSQENPFYKFTTTTNTNSQGEISISNLEWDIYHFSNFQKDSQILNLATSSPEHPISLSPDQNLETFFYLEAQNSLLITVLDSETLEPIFSATTTLSTNNFEETQYTNQNGQTIFIPLAPQIYTLSVEAAAYLSTSTTIYVSGQTTKLIKLLPVE